MCKTWRLLILKNRWCHITLKKIFFSLLVQNAFDNHDKLRQLLSYIACMHLTVKFQDVPEAETFQDWKINIRQDYSGVAIPKNSMESYCIALQHSASDYHSLYSKFLLHF